MTVLSLWKASCPGRHPRSPWAKRPWQIEQTASKTWKIRKEMLQYFCQMYLLPDLRHIPMIIRNTKRLRKQTTIRNKSGTVGK